MGVEIGNFCLFSVHKICLHGGKIRNVLSIETSIAYVIYKWSSGKASSHPFDFIADKVIIRLDKVKGSLF